MFQPRQHHLHGGQTQHMCNITDDGMLLTLANPRRSTKRRVRQHADVMLVTQRNHTTPDGVVVPRRQRNLHGVHLQHIQRLLQLGAVDVGQSHALQKSVLLQRLERFQARRELSRGVRRVQLVERKARKAQTVQTGLCGALQMRGGAIGNPPFFSSGEPAFGGNDHGGDVTGIGTECVGNQCFIVSHVGKRWCVHVRGVQQGHTRMQRCVNDTNRAVRVHRRVRQPHASKCQHRTQLTSTEPCWWTPRRTPWSPR